MRTNEDTLDFETEAEFKAYMADLAEKKRRAENRSAAAVRQDRMRKRRKRAENYWLVWLKTGTAAASWLEGLSDGVIEKARQEMVARNPEWARLRGVTEFKAEK